MRTTATAPRTAAPWQRALRDAVSSIDELCALLDLDPATLDLDPAAGRDFPLRVPRAFVDRMRPGDPRDPLLLQVLPGAAELVPAAGFVADPLAEERVSPAPGVLQKFHGRVLFVATGACAVHCRYCFRRHFPYAEHRPWGEDWRPALDHVAADPSIDEVILSGGDPLALADDRLAALAQALADVPHVTRLRIHSRVPIVLPERLDEAFLAWLCGTRLRPVLVLHANHPREIDGAVGRALAPLRARGVTLLNQAVLLRGVNDDAGVLADLSRSLFGAGVLPYYLHLLDPVAGAAHFEISEPAARRLHAALSARLPGYLVPRLVREVPGAPAKVAMA